MTSQKIKFYKFNSSTGDSATKIATAKATEGAVIYLVDVRELWIGGSTPKLVIKGANDVTFANNVLTITHYDNAGVATPQTLDFSDVASAQETFKVFEHVYQLMGATATGTTQTLDYSNTNYLESATNLVDADKALDTAIHTNTHKGAATGAVYDTEHLSSTWTTVVTNNTIAAGNTLDVDIDKLDKKIAGLADEVIANEQVTQEAFTAVANSVGLEDDMTLDLSDANLTVIKDDTSVKEALEDLDAAIAAIDAPVDDVKINGTSIVDSNDIANIAVEGTYNASTNKIATQSTVSDAIDGLDVNEYEQASVDVNTTNHTSTLKIKGIQEVDGKIAAATTTPTSDVAIDGEYNASSNKLATQSTVTNAINALNVNTDKGAASISGSTITINAVQQENGLIKDSGSTTINLDGTYDASTNKIATKSTVTSAIEALDATNIQGVDYTAADSSNGAKLTFKGVSETDGVIAQGTGTTELQFAKVATTGAAADVSIVDAQSKITATNVEDALTELATNIENLVGGMRYNGDISSATATLNTSTNDIRPGDIYLANGAFSIGSTSVEAGDMIVYKGDKSTSTVALDNTNCTIIEKETDTMVTAGDTLTDDYIVFGNGNKEVTTTSTVDSANYTVSAATLKDAITKANSALQSISKGTDGTYVTTTIGSKDANNDQKVSVAVAQSTVTYTAASDPNPATLTATNGLLNESAIPEIKDYVDAKVGTAVDGLDVAEYAQASVVVDSTTNTSTLKIKGIKEDDGKIAAATTTPTYDVVIDGVYDETNNKIATKSTVTNAINNLDKEASTVTGTNVSVNYSEADGIVTVNSVSESYATITRTAKASGVTPNLVVTSGDESKLVKASDITNAKLYTDDKIADEIEKLDATVSSQQSAVATVQVVEADGVITTVNVTTQGAGVTYSTTSGSPDLAASTSTGAVTGGDIATIKQYVDAVNCWEEYE